MTDTDVSDGLDDEIGWNNDTGCTEVDGYTRGRLTLLLSAMAMTFGFAIAALGPAMPMLRDDLDITRTVGGLHFSALAAGSVIAGIVVERIVASRGRRSVFWTGGAGVAAGALAIGAGWHPAVTVSGAFVVGSFGAAMLAVSTATLSDLHPAHHEIALTELNTSSSAGAVVPAVLIGAFAAAGIGWRPAFAVPLVMWIVVAVSRRGETFPPAGTSTSGSRHPLPRAYWLVWAAFAPAVAAEWALGAWGAGYLVDVAGTTEDSASLLMVSFFGAMLAGRLLGGVIARTVNALPLLIGAAAVGLGGTLLFWASHTVGLVVAGLLVAGLGISMLFPMLLSLAIDSAPGRSDTAAARVFISGGSAVLVAPLTLGAIADQTSIRAAFATVPLLFLLVVLLAVGGQRAATATNG